MSFSSDVKLEILKTWQKKNCCKISETYGLLVFGSKFNNESIMLKTENEEVSLHYRSMLKKTCDVICDTTISKNGIYKVSVPKNLIPKVLNVYGYNNNNTNTLNENLLKCTNCKDAFLRGSFLSGGTISDPSKEYHLEFAAKTELYSWSLCKILKSKDLDAKIIERNNQFIVYLKESENIEDILTIMGATKSSLEIMNTKIFKNIRNKTNRINNFETANIKKTAQSGVVYLEAIEKLEKNGVLDTLPYELYMLAIAKRDNIDMSLSELGKMFGLSRSGANHRLSKIIDISNKI